eukprot:599975-Pelagomonas_calceolata.AAC.3
MSAHTNTHTHLDLQAELLPQPLAAQLHRAQQGPPQPSSRLPRLDAAAHCLQAECMEEVAECMACMAEGDKEEQGGQGNWLASAAHCLQGQTHGGHEGEQGKQPIWLAAAAHCLQAKCMAEGCKKEGCKKERRATIGEDVSHLFLCHPPL